MCTQKRVVDVACYEHARAEQAPVQAGQIYPGQLQEGSPTTRDWFSGHVQKAATERLEKAHPAVRRRAAADGEHDGASSQVERREYPLAEPVARCPHSIALRAG